MSPLILGAVLFARPAACHLECPDQGQRRPSGGDDGYHGDFVYSTDAAAADPATAGAGKLALSGYVRADSWRLYAIVDQGIQLR